MRTSAFPISIRVDRRVKHWQQGILHSENLDLRVISPRVGPERMYATGHICSFTLSPYQVQVLSSTWLTYDGVCVCAHAGIDDVEIARNPAYS